MGGIHTFLLCDCHRPSITVRNEIKNLTRVEKRQFFRPCWVNVQTDKIVLNV